MTDRWVGIDPGARYTGLCAVIGKMPVHHAIVDREEGNATYLPRIGDALGAALGVHYRSLDFGETIGCAIEDVVAPVPHLGLARPADLIALGKVVGWLMHAVPGHVLVRPGGHGSKPWGHYPDELLTDRERANAAKQPLATAGQSSVMRHARSAYDVALAGRATARTGAPR